jgi:hypothetical protein
MIKDYFRNYLWNTCDTTLSLGRNPSLEFHTSHEEEDWTVTLADTGEESMTAYRVKQIQKYIPKGESFLLTHGDGLSTIDINATIEAHLQSKKPARFQLCIQLGGSEHSALKMTEKFTPSAKNLNLRMRLSTAATWSATTGFLIIFRMIRT